MMIRNRVKILEDGFRDRRFIATVAGEGPLESRGALKRLDDRWKPSIGSCRDAMGCSELQWVTMSYSQLQRDEPKWTMKSSFESTSPHTNSQTMCTSERCILGGARKLADVRFGSLHVYTKRLRFTLRMMHIEKDSHWEGSTLRRIHIEKDSHWEHL